MITSGTNLKIVQASAPDQLQMVRALFREYADSLRIDLSFQRFEQEIADLPGHYAPPRGCILLALVNDQPAGCVALRPQSDSGACEMKRLYVRPEHRRSGLGRTLAERVMHEGATLGYGRMRLDTISSIMGKAVSLYRALGFQAIEPYCDNPHPDAMFMECRLPPSMPSSAQPPSREAAI